VIRWDADHTAFINNALAPAKVLTVELFEDDGVALVVVPDYQLSLAIGREGQNVRLAARLTGWRLDIASESEAGEARERYLAERAERTAVEAPVEEGPVEAVEEAVEEPVAAIEEPAAPSAPAIDEELIRKLEEFKRERLGE
jgi:N utilization substance protein A